MPWVSRAAYDAVVSERDWLRGQLAAATEHNRRMERVEAGRPEVPIPHRPTREPMPPDVRAAIDAWASEDTRNQLEADAYRRYERDQSWDRVREALSATDDTD